MPIVRSSSSMRSRFARVATLFAIAALVACGGEAEEVTRRDCERLREHLIDMRMESVTADRDQHRAALEAVIGPSFIDGCREQISSVQLRCSLAAADTSALAACGEPSSP